MTTKIHVKLQSCTPSNAAFLSEKFEEDWETRKEAKNKKILDDYNPRSRLYKFFFGPDFDRLDWLPYDYELRDFLEELSKLDKTDFAIYHLEVDIALWNRYTSFHRKHLGDVKILKGE